MIFVFRGDVGTLVELAYASKEECPIVFCRTEAQWYKMKNVRKLSHAELCDGIETARRCSRQLLSHPWSHVMNKRAGLIEISLYTCLMLVLLVACARANWTLVVAMFFAILIACFVLAKVDLIGNRSQIRRMSTYER